MQCDVRLISHTYYNFSFENLNATSSFLAKIKPAMFRNNKKKKSYLMILISLSHSCNQISFIIT